MKGGKDLQNCFTELQDVLIAEGTYRNEESSASFKRCWTVCHHSSQRLKGYKLGGQPGGLTLFIR